MPFGVFLVLASSSGGDDWGRDWYTTFVRVVVMRDATLIAQVAVNFW